MAVAPPRPPCSPERVQVWLRRLPYNHEPHGPTLRSLHGVLRHGTAHCLEAALAAAVLLEPAGYPPLLLDLESDDRLDHVVFAYRSGGRWGAVGTSRDEGLGGRRAVYPSPYHLARSYYAPYTTDRARVRAWALADLRVLRGVRWRTSPGNLWVVERWLCALPHRPLRTSDRHYRRLRARFQRFSVTHSNHETPFRAGAAHWT